MRRGRAFLSSMTLEDRRHADSRVTASTQTTLVSYLLVDCRLATQPPSIRFARKPNANLLLVK